MAPFRKCTRMCVPRETPPCVRLVVWFFRIAKKQKIAVAFWGAMVIIVLGMLTIIATSKSSK